MRFHRTFSESMSRSNSETFLQDMSKWNNSLSTGENLNWSINADFRLEWMPDSMTNIIFRPSYSHSEGRSESASSPKKNTTIEVDVSAIDKVKVVVKEPEPKVVEELKTQKAEAEVQKEISKTVETENPAPSKSAEKKVVEQPKSTIGGPVITNERFKGGRRLESRFVTDLRKSLNFNDRFRYQRELFGGDMTLLNTTIEKLNSMSSLQEAEAYVAENFNWDTTEGAAFEFMELLEARFTN